jgi:hypothetical protein
MRARPITAPQNAHARFRRGTRRKCSLHVREQNFFLAVRSNSAPHVGHFSLPYRTAASCLPYREAYSRCRHPQDFVFPLPRLAVKTGRFFVPQSQSQIHRRIRHCRFFPKQGGSGSTRLAMSLPNRCPVRSMALGINPAPSFAAPDTRSSTSDVRDGRPSGNAAKTSVRRRGSRPRGSPTSRRFS